MAKLRAFPASAQAMRLFASSALPRAFHGLAVSNLAAQSAEQLSLAATPLVAVLALGAGPGEIGMLITDDGISEEAVTAFTARGIKVLAV